MLVRQYPIRYTQVIPNFSFNNRQHTHTYTRTDADTRARRQAGGQAGARAGMQADRYTHTHTHTHTHTLTHTHTSYRHSRTLPNSFSNGNNTEKRMSKNGEVGKVVAKVRTLVNVKVKANRRHFY